MSEPADEVDAPNDCDRIGHSDEPAAEWVALSSLVPFEGNPRDNEATIPVVADSVRRFGFGAPMVARRANRMILAGHSRRGAALLLAEQWTKATTRERATWHPDAVRVATKGEVVVRFVDLDEHDAALYLVADNRIGEELSETDDAKLAALLAGLSAEGVDLVTGIGITDEAIAALLGTAGPAGAGGAGPDPAAAASLAERFGVPPFSVLDARQGYWQERKRAWIALGIESEVGRGENLLDFSDTMRKGGGARLTYVAGDRAREDLDPVSGKILETGSGTSIFDPVLCELAYRWFSPPGGAVLDPFAGGSVRGLVAGWLGRRYIGVDLRAEQVAANEAQAARLFAEPRPGTTRPMWFECDSRRLDQVALSADYDLVFSCPPYADLERYSDDPRDLSTMDYAAFIAAYREIIAGACSLLRADRFACFVVGDVRDPKGIYRNFVSDTIAAFQAAGLALYNEAILVTQVGSLALRVGRQFEAARKLGKAHQNVLAFCKGDPKRATAACGPVEVAMPEDISPSSGDAGETQLGRYGEELA